MRVHRAACLPPQPAHRKRKRTRMPSAIPPESELRAAAARLGHADENGDYPTHLRKKIAAAVVEADKEITATAKTQPDGTTAEQLLAFHDELTDSRVPDEDARALLLAVAPALVRRQGLQTKGTRTP